MELPEGLVEWMPEQLLALCRKRKQDLAMWHQGVTVNSAVVRRA